MPQPARPSARPEDYVRRILTADDFPALSRQMGELMESLQEGEASAQRLANLVLRDYALTVKVIRTANTVHFNRTGRPVQSATQAMMLLGAQTVRDLASGLLLFEHYRHRSPGLKELMLLSLLTAGHAGEAAARLEIIDPEAAQLCGMFRNLGEVLVAAHLPSEYAAILRASADRGPRDARRARDAAAAQVLGCSLEDIGVAIAGDWGMPEAVCRGMRAVGERGEDTMALVTSFAHDLSSAIYREDVGCARQGVATVLERYGPRLKLSREVLAAIADGAVAATRETFAAAGVALDGLRLTRQIATALAEQSSDAAEAPGAAGAPAGTRARSAASTPAVAATGEHAVAGAAEGRAVAGSASGASAIAPGAPTDDGPPVDGPLLAALRDRLAREIESAAEDAGTYDVQRVLLIALESLLRGGPFDRACFCPIDVAARGFRARFGLGDGVEELLERFALPFAGPLPAGASLLRGQEVHLSSGTRLAMAEAQCLRAWGATTVALMPLALEGTTIGAIYLDRRATSAGLDATALVYVRRIIAAAGDALAYRRGLSPAAAHGPAARGTPRSLVAQQPPAPRPAEPPPPPLELAELPPAAVVARSELVLRVLRGEALASVAESAGISVDELETWRREFLDGAMARLAGG